MIQLNVLSGNDDLLVSSGLSLIEKYLRWLERLNIGFKFEFVFVFGRFARPIGFTYRFICHAGRELLAWCFFKLADQPIKFWVVPAIEDHDASGFGHPPACASPFFHEANAGRALLAESWFFNCITL